MSNDNAARVRKITALRTLIAAGDYDLIPGACPEGCVDVTTERVLQELRKGTSDGQQAERQSNGGV